MLTMVLSAVRSKRWALLLILPLLVIGISCEADIVEPASEDAFLLGAAPVDDEPCCTDGQTLPSEPDEQEPDALRGAQLFNGQVGNLQVACASCHSTGANTLVGPGLQGLPLRTAERVPGLDASEYITQSIRGPGDYIVEGFANLMPAYGEEQLDEFDLADLLAYLTEL